MRLSLKYWRRAALGLAFAGFIPVSAMADEPLEVLGVSIGMSAKDAALALTARADQGVALSGATQQSPKARGFSPDPNQMAPMHYTLGERGALSLEFTPSANDPKVSAIDYRIDDDPDMAARLERQLAGRFGAATSTYRLSGEQRLMVWEVAAPEQSRDFGPLMTIALTTYDPDQTPNARLSLSQFSRPAMTQGLVQTQQNSQASSQISGQSAVQPSQTARRASIFGPSD